MATKIQDTGGICNSGKEYLYQHAPLVKEWPNSPQSRFKVGWGILSFDAPPAFSLRVALGDSKLPSSHPTQCSLAN
eukprot:3207349-Amphidinium_carterae.1